MPESCPQLEREAECEPEPVVRGTYGAKAIAKFWARQAEIRQQDRELRIINEPSYLSVYVVGISDEDDTSGDEASGDDSDDDLWPLSPYPAKRPCELRNGLELHNRYAKTLVDVDAVVQRRTSSLDPNIYMQPGFKALRDRLSTVLSSAADDEG